MPNQNEWKQPIFRRPFAEACLIEVSCLRVMPNLQISPQHLLHFYPRWENPPSQRMNQVCLLPFARKAFEYDQAKIRYSDEEGKTFQINSGDFIFSGIDLSYYYYPQFKSLEESKTIENFSVILENSHSDNSFSIEAMFSASLSKGRNSERFEEEKKDVS